MTTKWVVTTATERVALDQATRDGEATFMVTNQSAKSARAMFDIKTGDGVEESWFTVEDPQRPIRPAASVPYLVRIQVPQQVPPGSYEFEARVFPPDSAPEENFVLSRRVLIEVPAPPAPVKKPFPWWIIVAAALLVLVIGVVTWLVWPSGAQPAPEPSPSPSPSAVPVPVDMTITPNLTKLNADQAGKALTDAGLVMGNVYYINGPVYGVARQFVPPGVQVPKGTKVDMDIRMPFSGPTITAPGANTSQEKGRWPTINWTQPEAYVNRFQVVIQAEECKRNGAGTTESCGYNVYGPTILVTGREYAGKMPTLSYTPSPAGTRHTGWVTVIVMTIDGYGNVVTAANVKFYLDH